VNDKSVQPADVGAILGLKIHGRGLGNIEQENMYESVTPYMLTYVRAKPRPKSIWKSVRAAQARSIAEAEKQWPIKLVKSEIESTC
jgi:hypothetical protein